MVTFVFWFRTHTEFKGSPGQYFPFPPLRQLIYEQLENVLCRGCGFTSQRYPSITPFIREIRTHAVCQWKGRSRWRRISPRRSAERSQTPLLWFWHSDTGCGGERGSDTHFHSVQLWCNNSTGFTGLFAVVTAWSCKILSGSWKFATEGGGERRVTSRESAVENTWRQSYIYLPHVLGYYTWRAEITADDL